jgi:hypothetical protein
MIHHSNLDIGYRIYNEYLTISLSVNFIYVHIYVHGEKEGREKKKNHVF